MKLVNERRLYTGYAIVYGIAVACWYFVSVGFVFEFEPVALLKSAIAGIGVSIPLVVLLNEYLWKRQLVRSLLGIRTPILDGRWRGFLRSSFTEHQTEHPIIMEFKQTLQHVGVWYYDGVAIAQSLTAQFGDEAEGGPFHLYCVYRNQPLRTHSPSLAIHDGTMQLVVEPDCKEIQGVYYNNPHQRATYGELHLQFDGPKRLGKFK